MISEDPMTDAIVTTAKSGIFSGLQVEKKHTVDITNFGQL